MPVTSTMKTGMTQPSRRSRRTSPRIGSRATNRLIPNRREGRTTQPLTDGERGMHATQVVALHVAEEDVVAPRQPQRQDATVGHVEALGLINMADARSLLIHGEPVALQWQLGGRPVGAHDDELVG